MRDTPNLTYYATAAQVIPVLMIVMVFEARATTRNLFGLGRPTRNLAFVVVLLACVGEIAALTALLAEDDSIGLKLVSSGAIYAALGFIAWYALPWHRHGDGEEWSELDPRRREPPSAGGGGASSQPN